MPLGQTFQFHIQSKLPLGFLCASLVIVIISIALGITAHEHDSKWNTRLDMADFKQALTDDTMQNGTSTFNEAQMRLFYRDTWMKKAFLAISSFLLLTTIIHVAIYVIYKEEHYRYNFTLIFTVIALFLYLGAGIFIITSTVLNQNHYHEINRLVETNHLTDTVILPLFQKCVSNEGVETIETHPDDKIEMRRKSALKDGICQLTEIKFAAGGLALFNILLLAGVILTTHSKKSFEEEELSNKRDLDYDENDEEWTKPLAVIQQNPRRLHDLKNLGLHKIVDKGAAGRNSDSTLIQLSTNKSETTELELKENTRSSQ